MTAATALLTVGVITSGFGLFMLAFAGLDLLLDPRRRRLVPALLVPAAIYLTWYVAYGRGGVATARDPLTLEAILSLPAFMVDGIGSALGSALGVGPLLGRAAAVVLTVGLLARFVRGGSVPGRALACFGAVVVQFAILGLIRAQLFEGAAGYSRYAYLSGILVLLGLVALVGRRPMPADPRRRMVTLSAIVGVFTLAMVWNVWLLLAGRELFADRADRTRAMVIVITGEPPAGVNPDEVELMDRTITRLREVLGEFGTPLQDALAGDAVRSVPASVVDEVRASLVRASDQP